MLDKIIQKIKDLIPKKGNVQPEKKEGTPPVAIQGNVPSEDEAKKKKKSLMIKVAVGVVLLYFVADEFLKEPATPVSSKPTASKVKKKDSPRVPKKTLKDNVKTETKEQAKAPEKTPEPKDRSISSVKPVKETPRPEETPKVEAQLAIEEPPKPEEAQQIEEPLTIEEPPKSEEAPKVEEPLTIDESTPSPEIAVEEQPVITEAPTEGISKDMDKIAEEIGPVSDMEEIQPAENVPLPDYTIRGRGLVYNCKEKHWACIDKAGYFSCRSQMKWSEENQKPADCAIKNVYSTEDECSTIQLHYINTLEPTDFCK